GFSLQRSGATRTFVGSVLSGPGTKVLGISTVPGTVHGVRAHGPCTPTGTRIMLALVARDRALGDGEDGHAQGRWRSTARARRRAAAARRGPAPSRTGRDPRRSTGHVLHRVRTSPTSLVRPSGPSRRRPGASRPGRRGRAGGRPGAAR